MINNKLLKQIFPKSQIHKDKIIYQDREVPIANDILRFSSNISYSTGNFSKLRDKFSELQFDSKNKTTDRLNTILQRTNWDKNHFKDKLILECGLNNFEVSTMRKFSPTPVTLLKTIDINEKN